MDIFIWSIGEWSLASDVNDNGFTKELELLAEVNSKLFKHVCIGTIYDCDSLEGISNAKLIVASQDLLKACQEMWIWIMKQNDWIGEDPKKEWKQAIEKAIN